MPVFKKASNISTGPVPFKHLKRSINAWCKRLRYKDGFLVTKSASPGVFGSVIPGLYHEVLFGRFLDMLILVGKSFQAATSPAYISALFRGTQRRFPPKYVQKTFYAIQNSIRSLKMHCKRRYKMGICSVILEDFESFRNYKGFNIIFPKIFRFLAPFWIRKF